jgi:hypothetical protein
VISRHWFTTSEATATTTPALSFTPSTFAAHTFYGNNTGSTATPGAQAIGEADVTNLVSDLALKAPLASPVFTGLPTIPSFTNSTHTHLNPAGGGLLDAAAINTGVLVNARVNFAVPGTIRHSRYKFNPARMALRGLSAISPNLLP